MIIQRFSGHNCTNSKRMAHVAQWSTLKARVGELPHTVVSNFRALFISLWRSSSTLWIQKKSPFSASIKMKHYRAKPSAQLSKDLQDDIKYAVVNWTLSNHKNVHCMRLHNARAICQLDNHVLISRRRHDLKLDIDESAKSHQA